MKDTGACVEPVLAIGGSSGEGIHGGTEAGNGNGRG